MKKLLLTVLTGVVVGWAVNVRADDDGAHRFGVGAHYWTAVKDIDIKDVDKDGLSWVATYQYKPSALGLGIDVEWKEKGFAGAAKDVYEPQAYLILGRNLYAAAGVGGYYTDGDFAKDPFYFFRAGFDASVLPSVHLDIHGIYRFEEWKEVHSSTTDPDSDTITIGVAVRIAL